MFAVDGPLWGLTTFFNPRGYRTRRDNYDRFRARSRAQGLPLLTVELVGTDAEPGLREGRDAERLIVVRSDERLWHKEKLLNLGLAALPDSCDAVCWIDADVLFDRADWVPATHQLLAWWPVVQPFSAMVKLPQGGDPARWPAWKLGISVWRGNRTGQWTPSFAACWRSPAARLQGTTGYAWAARRSLLEAHGFYDRCVVGGADREMALAFTVPTASLTPAVLRIHAPHLRQDLARWRDPVWQQVQGRLGVLPGVLHHQWHGEPAKRNYEGRHRILQDLDFDPLRHLQADAGGTWRWTPEAGPLADAVAAYLEARAEDG
jgi:hypothetical protein